MAYSFNNYTPSAARTANGSGTTISADPARHMSALINITAVSGTSPTLVVSVEGSTDGSTWFTLGATGSLVAAGKQVLNVGPLALPPQLRVSWVIGGTTPSWTFRVDLGIF